MCKRNPWSLATSCSTNNNAAGVKCNVNGVWSLWGSWSSCSVTCADGIEQRTRQCDHPPALHGGKPCPGDALQTRPCTLPACPIDGVWMSWESWSACSETCGEGTHRRNRTCNGPFHGGAQCPGNHSQTELCQDAECPIDGHWRDWVEWGPCNVTCGGGQQKRERVCVEPQYGGEACNGAAVEWRNCNTNNCPVNGHWMDWGQWSTCKVSCGGGIETRSRECYHGKHGGMDCVGGLPEETRQCNTQTCAVDGVWNRWGAWSICTVSCGNGTQTRSRTCHGPFYGGRDCDGITMDIRECNTQFCPVDGAYNNWSDWSTCTVTCGGGNQWHNRTCIGPFFGGRPCQGPANETQDCNMQHCPIDGFYSDWSQWGTCTVTCGGGTQSRSRICTQPQYGGKDCQGPADDSQDCNTHHCPVDGVWYSWSDWGTCNVTCGGGVRERTRDCETPKYGGADCIGRSSDYLVCNENPCPIPGDWSAWEPWTICAVTCGGGKRQRKRVCDMTSYGDLTAPCLGDAEEIGDCHTHACKPYASTCAEWGERGLTVNTMADIDPFRKPDGQQDPIRVYCDMESENGIGITVIGHDQQAEEEVVGYEGAGEFQLEINYNVTLPQAIAIIDNSKFCKQFISWKCKAALIHNPNGLGSDSITTGWRNRTWAISDYFGGGSPGSGKCACGMTNSCADSALACNCDMNDDVWREDSGFLTYKDDLPVVEFIAGDTGAGDEMGIARVGYLFCKGVQL